MKGEANHNVLIGELGLKFYLDFSCIYESF